MHVLTYVHKINVISVAIPMLCQFKPQKLTVKFVYIPIENM